MISINTNLSSLIAQNSLKTSTNKLNKTIERMSSGYKINHAKDNAANYSISTNMTTKIGAYSVAQDNAAMGLDMVTTASENLSLIEDKLTRLRSLATQAQNGTYGTESKGAINLEVNSIVDEIEKLYSTNEYNGIKMTSGEKTSFINDIERRDTSGMTKLEEVDENIALTSGTYSISSANELEKLARMTNLGLVQGTAEFVLANDIDLGHIANWTPIGLHSYQSLDYTKAFQGKFDGNGYVISNLTIDSTSDNDVGLFGYARDSEFKNIALENVNIRSTEEDTASLLGAGARLKIDNCYATGDVSGKVNTGGLLGYLFYTDVYNSYSKTTILGTINVGGFIAAHYGGSITNCYAESFITSQNVGGFAGISHLETYYLDCYAKSELNTLHKGGGFIGFSVDNSSCKITLENCYVDTQPDISSVFVNLANGSDLTIKNCQYNIECKNNNVPLVKSKPTTGLYETSNISTFNGEIPFRILTKGFATNQPVKKTNLQVGINNNKDSQIKFDFSYSIKDLSELRYIGLNDKDFINKIDNYLEIIFEKQTELGAVQNRLESVLDEIATQYDNLVSSRSTLRDADIAEESSKMIKQQILQEASATLMASSRNLRYENVLGLLQGIR